MSAVVNSYYAASTICRAASVLFGPYAPDWFPWWRADEAQVVELPEPAELARLLAKPKPRRRAPYTPPLGRRWVQPVLFEAVG